MSTLTPCCNMGVITMKTMSSTSITSTMGVTLMLELTLAPSLRTAIAIEFNLLPAGLAPKALDRQLPVDAPLLQEIVDQLAGAVVHFHVESFHLVGEVVEHHDSRNGDEQSDSGGHQRFRNTAGDSAQTSGLLRRNLFERIQNAHHRSEQSHERCGGTDSSQTTQAAFQLGVCDGLSTLQSALGGLDLLARNVGGIAVGLELLQTRSNHLGQVALLVALADLDGFFDLAFTQGAGNGGSEGPRLFTRGAECHRAIDHHADRPS